MSHFRIVERNCFPLFWRWILLHPPNFIIDEQFLFIHLQEGGETLSTQRSTAQYNEIITLRTKYIRKKCTHYNDILSIVNKTVKQIHSHTCINDSNFFMGYRVKSVFVCVYADRQAFIFLHSNINQKLFRGIYSFLSLHSRCVKTKKKISRNRSVKVCVCIDAIDTDIPLVSLFFWYRTNIFRQHFAAAAAAMLPVSVSYWWMLVLLREPTLARCWAPSGPFVPIHKSWDLVLLPIFVCRLLLNMRLSIYSLKILPNFMHTSIFDSVPFLLISNRFPIGFFRFVLSSSSYRNLHIRREKNSNNNIVYIA